MNQQNRLFSPQTLFLGVAVSSLAGSLSQARGELSARLFLLHGFPAALALCLLSALLTEELSDRELFSGQSILSRLGCGVFWLWFGVELVRTAWAAQQVCQSQFSSMAVLSALPLLLWAGWALPEAALDRSARVLWGLAVLGVLFCIIGLAGQLHWQNLLPAETHRPDTSFQLPVFPEYFALALLCPQRQWSKAVWMPLGAFFVQFAFCLGMELLFGAGQGSDLAGYELLRAWKLGALSRFDAVFLLLWLAAMLFRVCVLAKVLRLLWVRLCGQASKRPFGEVGP